MTRILGRQPHDAHPHGAAEHADSGGLRYLDDDTVRDACGVFGVWGHPDAAHVTYCGLYALQHRGQESAGIVA